MILRYRHIKFLFIFVNAVLEKPFRIVLHDILISLFLVTIVIVSVVDNIVASVIVGYAVDVNFFVSVTCVIFAIDA